MKRRKGKAWKGANSFKDQLDKLGQGVTQNIDDHEEEEEAEEDEQEDEQEVDPTEKKGQAESREVCTAYERWPSPQEHPRCLGKMRKQKEKNALAEQVVPEEPKNRPLGNEGWELRFPDFSEEKRCLLWWVSFQEFSQEHHASQFYNGNETAMKEAIADGDIYEVTNKGGKVMYAFDTMEEGERKNQGKLLSWKHIAQQSQQDDAALENCSASTKLSMLRRRDTHVTANVQ